MASQIVKLGHPALRTVATRVAGVAPAGRPGDVPVWNRSSQDTVAALFAAVKEDGDTTVGLAAPQLGRCEAIFIFARMNSMPTVGATTRRVGPLFFEAVLNPVVVSRSEECQESVWEECRSIPGLLGLVRRPEGITARYVSDGNVLREDRLGGMEARVFQHELDHLAGKTYLDVVEDRQADVVEMGELERQRAYCEGIAETLFREMYAGEGGVRAVLQEEHGSLEGALEAACGGLVHPQVVWDQVGEFLEMFAERCEGAPLIEDGNMPWDKEFDRYRHRPAARAAAAEEAAFDDELAVEAEELRAGIRRWIPKAKVAELKAALRDRGLSAKGKKTFLQARLGEALDREAGAERAASLRSREQAEIDEARALLDPAQLALHDAGFEVAQQRVREEPERNLDWRTLDDLGDDLGSLTEAEMAALVTSRTVTAAELGAEEEAARRGARLAAAGVAPEAARAMGAEEQEGLLVVLAEQEGLAAEARAALQLLEDAEGKLAPEEREELRALLGELEAQQTAAQAAVEAMVEQLAERGAGAEDDDDGGGGLSELLTEKELATLAKQNAE